MQSLFESILIPLFTAFYTIQFAVTEVWRYVPIIIIACLLLFVFIILLLSPLLMVSFMIYDMTSMQSLALLLPLPIFITVMTISIKYCPNDDNN